jgi:hypothetical protein
MTVWAIAQDSTSPNGRQGTAYWCGPDNGLLGRGDLWTSKELATARDRIATWPTKREATEAFRKAGRRLGGARVVELPDADAAIVAPDSHNVAGCSFNAYETRTLTDEIREEAEQLWEKIASAYTGRAWAALGYATWDEYCATEFGSIRLRLPKEERRDAVCSPRESGLSIRAIASAAGISDQTVQRDLASGVVNHYTSPDDGQVIDAEVVPGPKPITGLDDKTYPAKPKRKPSKPQRELPPEYAADYAAARKAFDEAEAALTPQERARRQKEADAYAHGIGDQIIASFSGVIVNSVIGCLEELADDIRKLVERGGVTGEQLRGIEAAHASYAAELDVLRMSERGPGASS